MRHLLASVVLLLAVAAPTTAHAATPLDPLPVTMGTFTGAGGCDAGRCRADLQLVGRFAIGGGSFPSTAALTWSGPDDAERPGTITAPRFQGACLVRDEAVRAEPLVGVPYDIGVSCDVHLDGGLATCHLAFSYETTNLADSSSTQSGNFYPWGLEPVVAGSTC